jgi:GAF domain-containing protein
LGVAQSAGISILDDADNRFHWPAIAGAWAKFLGGSMPYDASPCGVVVARNASLLFRDPQLAFPDAAVDPLIREILLSPLRVHGRTIGTVWALYHDDGRHFDAEHARLLESLAHLAGSAHWLASSLTRVAAERDRSAAQAAELARNRVELEESESRFRNMADHAPVMMWVTDVHGRCTYLNRCWYE